MSKTLLYDGKEFGLGCIRDNEVVGKKHPKYTRLALQAATTLPQQVDLRPFFPPVFNQGKYGTCVACTATALREYYISKEMGGKPNKVTRLSPMFIYNASNENSNDSGMRSTEGLLVLNEFGICEAYNWPYPSSYSKSNLVAPTAQQKKEALKYATPSDTYGDGEKERAYYSARSLDEIKTVLAAGHPLVLSITVTETFNKTPKSGSNIGLVSFPVKDEKVDGGHSLLIVGYDDTLHGGSYIVRNSWGTTFGDNGYCYMPYLTAAAYNTAIFIYEDGEISWSLDTATVDSIHAFYLPLSFKDENLPQQGVSLTVTKNASNQAVLNFSSTGINSTGTEIYRDGKKITKVSEGVKTYTDTEVNSGTHKYYVGATNRNGVTLSKKVTNQLALVNGDGDETITLSVEGEGGSSFSNPIVIIGTTASGNVLAEGSVYFKYIPSVSGTFNFETASSLDLKMELYSSTQTLISTDDDNGAGSNPLISSSLVSGQAYYLRVYGYNSTVAGAFTLNVTPQGSGGTAPSTPSLTVGGATSNSLTLYFSASGASSFDIYRNGSLLVSGQTSTSYVDSGLLPNTPYSYYVIARNSYGSSTSTTMSGTTLSNSGVTPTTIVEDFADQNYNFNIVSNGFSWASTKISPGTFEAEIFSGESKEFYFTVNVPNNATTKKLNMTFKYPTGLAATGASFEILVNDIVKYTSGSTSNFVTTPDISLGTGAQTVKVRAKTTKGGLIAIVDSITVSWS